MPTQQGTLPWMDPRLTDDGLTPEAAAIMQGATIAQGNGPTSPFPQVNRWGVTPEMLQQMSDAMDQAAGTDTGEYIPQVEQPLAPQGDAPLPPPQQPDTPPAPQGQQLPPPQAPVQEQAPAAPTTDEFTFKVGDQEAKITADQAAYLIQLNNYLSNIPDQVRGQWAEIEQGTHLSIPKDEYAQFKAWQAVGAPAPTDNAPDLTDLSPEQAAYVQRLQQAATPPPPPPPPAQPQVSPEWIQQQVHGQAQALNDQQQVTQSFVTKYNLSPEQIARLEQATIQSGAISRIEMQSRQVSPTGHIISRAPFSQVLTQAFEETMLSDPVLRAVRDDYVYNERLTRDQAANQAVTSKKAAAASLASTNTAAVTSGQNPQKPQTPQDTIANIVAFLNESQANGTDSL